MSEDTLLDRFDAIARQRLGDLQEQYGRMSLIPLKTGDLDHQRRHNMFRSMLGHILLLQKALGLRPSPRPAGASPEQALEAALAELREMRDD